jgi:hypothetical protein
MPISNAWLFLSSFVFSIATLAPTASYAAVNPPAQLISGYRPSTNKPEVLIYYSNETAPDERELRNYSTIINWLKSTRDPKALVVVDQLTRDLREFHEAVDIETHAIVQPSNADGTPTAVFIFTNRLGRKGHFLLKKKEEPGVQSLDFKTPIFDSYILSSNPLSDARTFKEALNAVVRLYNPNKYDFVLISKSHGASNLALTPRLAVRAEQTSPSELISLLQGNANPLPDWAKNRLGIQKADFMSILGKAGQDAGMFFRLVFLESCYSEVSTEDSQGTSTSVPHNISALVTTHGETPYRSVNYAELFNTSSNELFSARLIEQLASISASQKPVPSLPSNSMLSTLKKGLYYVPLLILTIYFVLAQTIAKRRFS